MSKSDKKGDRDGLRQNIADPRSRRKHFRQLSFEVDINAWRSAGNILSKEKNYAI